MTPWTSDYARTQRRAARWARASVSGPRGSHTRIEMARALKAGRRCEKVLFERWSVPA